MGFEQKRMRRHETTSSSEEDDSVDLLGSNYQVKSNYLHLIQNKLHSNTFFISRRMV